MSEPPLRNVPDEVTFRAHIALHLHASNAVDCERDFNPTSCNQMCRQAAEDAADAALSALMHLPVVKRAALVGIELTEEESAEKYATIPAEELHTSHGGLNYQPRTRFVTSWRSSGDPS